MKPLTRKTKRQPERVFNHPELSERVDMTHMANDLFKTIASVNTAKPKDNGNKI